MSNPSQSAGISVHATVLLSVSGLNSFPTFVSTGSINFTPLFFAFHTIALYETSRKWGVPVSRCFLCIFLLLSLPRDPVPDSGYKDPHRTLPQSFPYLSTAESAPDWP